MTTREYRQRQLDRLVDLSALVSIQIVVGADKTNYMDITRSELIHIAKILTKKEATK